MLARILRHGAWVLFVAAGAAAAAPDPSPVFRLPTDAAPVRHDVRLAIDPDVPTFEGEIEIEMKLARDVPIVWLNASALDVERAALRQGASESAAEVVPGGADFVGLRAAFKAGAATVRIAYRGKLDDLGVEGLFRQQDGGDWYVFSQFQAIGARRAFPCFDEPQFKTPWRITIDAPASQVVVANTPEIGEGAMPGREGWKRHVFAETRPLPTYLVALAVGPFDVLDGGTAGEKRTPLRYYTPRGRAREARYASEATPRLLERLEEYFGTPYPFEKLDSIAIPQTLTFGAMENVGLISYGSTLMLAAPREDTPRFRELLASTIAHEVAHMWFGNLVTLAWWDDTWLNESFASWVGSKVTYAFEPSWDNGVEAGRSRSQALAADRLASARSIAAPVLTRNAIDDAFDDITYNKGEEVLAMFEAWLGPDRFRGAVREFLARHAYGTATSADFFAALGHVGPLESFVKQPGAPLLDAKLDCSASPAIAVAPQRFRPKGSQAADLQWSTPACFRYGDGKGDATKCAEVSSGTRIPLPSCPAWIVANAGGRGHYLARYDAALLARILDRAAAVPSKELQALARDTLLLAESGLVTPADALRVADAVLANPSPHVRLAGVALLEGLRDDWLKPEERRAKAQVVARRLMPMARELGWEPRARDSAEAVALRAAVMPYAASRDEGVALRSPARALALKWVANPHSVDATMAKPLLETAARFADARTFARLERAAVAGRGMRERSLVLGALARARDPVLRTRALALSLATPDGSTLLPGRDAYTLLAGGLRDDESRSAALEYVVDHIDALEAKLPRDMPASLIVPMGRACTRAERQALEAAFSSRAANYMTGALRLQQALESVDLCVSAHR